jgi:uncharacterized protein YlxW (UPF0749 family)
MDPRAFLVFVLMFGGVMVVLRPLAAALADRIRRPAVPPGEDQQELVDEVRAMRQELSELAERVDFTERLLARNSESARVDQREG